ncbi:hypothetical protein DQW50_09530 [Halorubrum sp. 48-1-W]|uniref:hypothetical protein n=1 Tax=Halorubrum sp. 48-1-W TaxID=2249761 RepID=UPI000DCF0520|nr:hypothetical protein [Halorubrum sp. 48-1-W]RAW45375.1 hypothetical protein DQW50_09530 [Halorubrum sp. 48-1-W]
MSEGEKRTEACGRCSMSTVVDAVSDGEGDADRDPFAGERIEVDESAIRRVSPAGFLGDLKARIDDAARRIAYGR